MKRVGEILELWRYPVSSLGGEKCQSVGVDRFGISGDREFGLFDPMTGRVAAPEKEPRWRPSLFLKSGIDEETGPYITFPDQTTLGVGDSALSNSLSNHFGFDVAIGRYREDPGGWGKSLPVISNRYVPSALHLLTRASVENLQQLSPSSNVNRLRFRPSIFLATHEQDGFIEDTWLGSTLRLGEVRVTVTEKTSRCGMTFIPMPHLGEEPEILRTIVRQNGRKLGVYGEIVSQGTLSVGDAVVMIS